MIIYIKNDFNFIYFYFYFVLRARENILFLDGLSTNKATAWNSESQMSLGQDLLSERMLGLEACNKQLRRYSKLVFISFADGSLNYQLKHHKHTLKHIQ